MYLSKYEMACVHAAEEFIKRNLFQHHSIPEIAKHVGLSSTKLKNAFKSNYGMGLFEYWETHRLNTGKEMIEASEQSIKQISKTLGFKYSNNFSTAFKKKFGKTPGDWKKDYRQ